MTVGKGVKLAGDAVQGESERNWVSNLPVSDSLSLNLLEFFRV
jgi:hypothetical protein